MGKLMSGYDTNQKTNQDALKNVTLEDYGTKTAAHSSIMEMKVDGTNSILGFVSTNNSTTSTLTGSATYTGTGEQTLFPQVGVMCKSDVSGTLFFDFSNDGTNWDSTFPVNGFSCAAGVSEFHTAIKLGRYFRVRYVNDSDAQSYFRLSTYYGNTFVPGVAPLNQTASLDQDAIFTRSTVPQDEIRTGRRSGVTGWNKFGYNEDIDTAASEVIWAFGGTFIPLTSPETFTITYNSSTDGAGGGATGATQLTIYYVDSNGLPAIGVHTLGSSGSDTTSFSGLGINRVAVSASGSAETNVNDITFTATTATTNQAIVPAGGSVTQQCIFFVGSNHTAVAKHLFINVDRASGGGSPRVVIKGWVYNRSIGTKFEIFRAILNTSVRSNLDIIDPVGFNLNATDVLWFEGTTSANNTAINIRFSLNEYQNT